VNKYPIECRPFVASFVVKITGQGTGVRISEFQESVGKSNCVLCGSLRAPRETRMMYDEPSHRFLILDASSHQPLRRSVCRFIELSHFNSSWFCGENSRAGGRISEFQESEFQNFRSSGVQESVGK